MTQRYLFVAMAVPLACILIFHNSNAFSPQSPIITTRLRHASKKIPQISHDRIRSKSALRQNLSYDNGDNDGNDQNGNENDITLNRREALMTSASLATSIFLMTSESASAAATQGISKKDLTNLSLGEGQWSPFKSAQTQTNIASQPFARNIIPPNFATYLSRFLIAYDDGVSSWWQQKEQRYSLLPSAESRKKLGKDFGSFARSNQISLGNFVIENTSIGSIGAGADTEVKLNNDAEIQQKFEELLRVFVKEYGSEDNGEAKRHLGLLFSILPPKYQPVQPLRELFSTITNETEENNIQQQQGQDQSLPYPTFKPSPGKLSVAYTEALTQLLPSKFTPYYDASTKSFTIQPSLNLYEVGVADEFGQNAIATIFGPLSSTPLKRERPEQSLGIYTLLGLSGGLGCALTHSLVIPVDVVKTRLQSDPDRYSNIYDGAMDIAQTEGLRGFSLGAQATIAGYFWYGLSVYPSYAFSKWCLTNVVLDPALAMANADGIALVAGAIAAIIASFGLTPLEACRIRTVSEPEIYRDIGLVGTASAISSEDSSLGWKALYAGLPSLLARQIIFGSVKFLAYERACEALFLTWPFLRDTTVTVLGVTIAAGALSGALSSVVSQPADSVLTYVANNKGGDGASLGVIEGSQIMVKNEGVSSLFRGLGSRCVWAALIISGQFFLYDIFKNALGINADDLSEVFQFIIK